MNKIVFFGNERLATGVEETPLYCLESLHNAGFEIAAIVSHYEPGRSRKSRPLEVKTFADEHGIPLLLPDSPASVQQELHELGAEIGVLVAYGKLISPAMISLFPKGIINLHPSLLPKYRGPTPIEQTLLDGTTTTGVSIMQLDAGMDSGPLFAQELVEINTSETKFELANRLLKTGATLIVNSLPGILEGTLKPIPQDESKATLTSLITKADGEIDWAKPAAHIAREVRAYAGWPGSYTEIASKRVIVKTVRIREESGKPGTIFLSDYNLCMYAGKGALEIERLQPAGKSEMSGRAFAAGLRL